MTNDLGEALVAIASLTSNKEEKAKDKLMTDEIKVVREMKNLKELIIEVFNKMTNLKKNMLQESPKLSECLLESTYNFLDEKTKLKDLYLELDVLEAEKEFNERTN